MKCWICGATEEDAYISPDPCMRCGKEMCSDHRYAVDWNTDKYLCAVCLLREAVECLENVTEEEAAEYVTDLVEELEDQL